MDVKEQVLTEIKGFPLSCFQFDESTDLSLCYQLLGFVIYINSCDIKDELLVCIALETTTKADDVMEILTFFQDEDGKHVWGLYKCDTGYAGIEIMIPVGCEEASTSRKGHPLHDSSIFSGQ